jgi:hypothetical protein
MEVISGGDWEPGFRMKFEFRTCPLHRQTSVVFVPTTRSPDRHCSISVNRLECLRSKFPRELIQPGDPTYDKARKIGTSHSPAMLELVRCM